MWGLKKYFYNEAEAVDAGFAPSTRRVEDNGDVVFGNGKPEEWDGREYVPVWGVVPAFPQIDWGKLSLTDRKNLLSWDDEFVVYPSTNEVEWRPDFDHAVRTTNGWGYQQFRVSRKLTADEQGEAFACFVKLASEKAAAEKRLAEMTRRIMAGDFDDE